MSSVQDIRNAQRADSPASILAIGTANPPEVMYQADFPEFYFRVTNSQHMTNLKRKFQHICERSLIKKRHLLLTEEILQKYPSLCDINRSSLDVRQDILVTEVPKLGKDAAIKAIEEWGQPISKITHLIFCTSAGVDMPGADFQLVKLLGLNGSVKRVMIYQQGCYAGGTVLRLAKDIAENNRGARVLVVCSEISLILFRGPDENYMESLVGQALFGDGAVALIVGADPWEAIEQPIFQLIWAGQCILPDSENAVRGRLRQVGLEIQLSKKVPDIISKEIHKALAEAFGQLGISDWNSIFWVTHPGGPAILNQIQAELGLNKNKLNVSRDCLSEYGNMFGASVLFTLDEMRKRSLKEGKATTGEGLDWGVLFGFGPGLTIETLVLHSVPTKN